MMSLISGRKKLLALVLVTFFSIISAFQMAAIDVEAASSGVKIGQACCDERGKTKGGRAGDQTGREAVVGSWNCSYTRGAYNNWEYVFRCKDKNTARKLAQRMKETCANDHIGYDQQQPDRFTFHDEAKKVGWNIAAIKTNCETTCTSAIAVCLNSVGIPMGRLWTVNHVYNDLTRTGKFTVLTSSKYTHSSSLLEPGDILLSSCHAAMVVESSNSPGTDSSLSTPAATGESTLRTEGVRQPGSIVEGNAFSIAGTVESNYLINQVTVSVVDTSGRVIINASYNPYDVSCRLGILDSDVKFGTLGVGEYTYRITAVDAKKGPIVLHENKFEIVKTQDAGTAQKASKASTLKGTGLSEPDAVTSGAGFNVAGTITSNKTITEVSIVIIKSNGKTVLKASAEPKASSYNLKKLNSKLAFSKLSKGKYRYVVTASDKKQTLVLLDKTFTVTEGSKSGKNTEQTATPKTSKKKAVTITATRLPSKLKKGAKFSFWGKIKSDKVIKKVTVQVLNSKGKVVLKASASPKKKSYNIIKLDRKIVFGKLKAGTYKFRVKARTSAGWTTLINKTFKVRK